MSKRKPRLIEKKLEPGQGFGIFPLRRGRGAPPEERVPRRSRWARRIYRLIGFQRAAKLRQWLNRLTRGRVGLYSSVEHHSDGPSAKVVGYYQFDHSAEIGCRRCGWRGPGDSASLEMYAEVFDLSCPSCGRMVVVVGYPTFEEVEQAARKGNPEAQRDWNQICEQRARQESDGGPTERSDRRKD